LLTLVGNRIYFNTNFGLIAAIETENGAVCWISRYDRAAGKSSTAGSSAPMHFARDPSPCVYHDGLLVVAPSDTPAIFALDAETGKTVWRQDQLPDELNVLGIVRNSVIIGGERAANLDAASGEIKWVWPESPSAGIRGMGRGIVAGREIFWPTRDQLYVLDSQTGSQTRMPIDLAPLKGGANFAAAHGCVVLAGYDKLMVFGPPSGPMTSTLKQKPQNRVGSDR
jgi:cellulose synthase operon protein C